MEWDLLEKTMFWIEGVDLDNANLDQIAAVAANNLGLQPKEVMVVDVRPGLVAFDVLKRIVQAEDIAGKGESLLRDLEALPNVVISEKATIHSEGILGFIAIDPCTVKDILRTSSAMAAEIRRAVVCRAMVFSSGAEVLAKKIEDTNAPYILSQLEKRGYKACFGGVLEDNPTSAFRGLDEALQQGYGLVITTGGVGAEDKDYSIEAVQRLDPLAFTPWILKFARDYQRHHKDGVRIAVGQVQDSLLVALPGPHEEARLGCDRLLEGLERRMEPKTLAEFIASAIRERWSTMLSKGAHSHGT